MSVILLNTRITGYCACRRELQLHKFNLNLGERVYRLPPMIQYMRWVRNSIFLMDIETKQ